MGHKQLETKSRNRMNRDPLMGAPGHTLGTQTLKPSAHLNLSGDDVGAADAGSPGSAELSADSAEAGDMNSILSSLTGMIGEDNVAKIRKMIATNARDIETKIAAFIDGLEMPKMPKMSSMKYPIAGGAAVAAGLGSAYLIREYLKAGGLENMFSGTDSSEGGRKSSTRETSTSSSERKPAKRAGKTAAASKKSSTRSGATVKAKSTVKTKKNRSMKMSQASSKKSAKSAGGATTKKSSGSRKA